MYVKRYRHICFGMENKFFCSMKWVFLRTFMKIVIATMLYHLRAKASWKIIIRTIITWWCCYHDRSIVKGQLVYVKKCSTAPCDCRPLDQPTSLSQKSVCMHLRNYIHHHQKIRHLLLVSPKADTYFTIPQRVECWVGLGGWLHNTEISSKY